MDVVSRGDFVGPEATTSTSVIGTKQGGVRLHVLEAKGIEVVIHIPDIHHPI